MQIFTININLTFIHISAKYLCTGLSCTLGSLPPRGGGGGVGGGAASSQLAHGGENVGYLAPTLSSYPLSWGGYPGLGSLPSPSENLTDLIQKDFILFEKKSF